MANQPLITRRAAFVGALASTAALAVPAVAAVRPESKGDQLQRFLDTASPDGLLQYHASQIAKALCQIKPGVWHFNLDHVGDRGNFVLFNYEAHPTFVGYVQQYH